MTPRGPDNKTHSEVLLWVPGMKGCRALSQIKNMPNQMGSEFRTVQADSGRTLGVVAGQSA